MTTQLKNQDFFESYPFYGFKSIGSYNNTEAWEWRSDCAYACFYLVTRGELYARLDDGRELTAREGDVLFLRSCDKAVLGSREPEGNCHDFISFYYDESFDLEIATLVRGADAKKLSSDIYEAHHSAYPLARLRLYTYFMKLVYQLASKTLKGTRDYSAVYQIQSAAEYINLNCQKTIKEEDLCRVSGYSPAHLRRLFIKYYARSPRDYILDRKIEMAKEMLLDKPPKSVQEIAVSLDFCSPSYFCKLFKQRVGLTPLEYKDKFDA
ncbi:MAG: helix-turn-helix transcriptional regulator [Clostridia bacterium]|nr:helix-turn-helix transcriptional regulator [Clostridia bacterium]